MSSFMDKGIKELKESLLEDNLNVIADWFKEFKLKAEREKRLREMEENISMLFKHVEMIFALLNEASNEITRLQARVDGCEEALERLRASLKSINGMG